MHLVNLEDNLKDKEALLQAIKDSQKALSNNLLEAMKCEYHKKIRQLQEEMERLEVERAENVRRAGGDASQRGKVEDQYRKKLKEVETQLRDAK